MKAPIVSAPVPLVPRLVPWHPWPTYCLTKGADGNAAGAAASATPLATASAWSMIFFVKWPTTPVDTGPIISQYSGVSGKGFRMTPSSASLSIAVDGDGQSCTLSTGVLAVGEWNIVAIRWDGAATVDLYLNGSDADTDTAAGNYSFAGLDANFLYPSTEACPISVGPVLWLPRLMNAAEIQWSSNWGNFRKLGYLPDVSTWYPLTEGSGNCSNLVGSDDLTVVGMTWEIADEFL